MELSQFYIILKLLTNHILVFQIKNVSEAFRYLCEKWYLMFKILVEI